MNLVNINDFSVLFERVKERGIGYVRHLFSGKNKRVENSWSGKSNVSSWWQIEEVQQRLREKITGDKELDIVNYVSEKYINKNMQLSGISLGCGLGAKELDWTRTNKNLKLKAFDISERRINSAENNLPNELKDRLSFFASDVNKLSFDEKLFDIIITDSALHHFSPLENVIKSVAKWLKDDGIFVVNEYVGPSRFQWQEQQLMCANRVLQALPAKYRTKRNGEIKHEIYRAGFLTMYLSDPSESAESGKITQLLDKYFRVIEKKECGGALLHILLKDIAHNFADKSHETDDLLKDIFAKEDAFMRSGELSSDFNFWVLKVKNET